MSESTTDEYEHVQSEEDLPSTDGSRKKRVVENDTESCTRNMGGRLSPDRLKVHVIPILVFLSLKGPNSPLSFCSSLVKVLSTPVR